MASPDTTALSVPAPRLSDRSARPPVDEAARLAVAVAATEQLSPRWRRPILGPRLGRVVIGSGRPRRDVARREIVVRRSLALADAVAVGLAMLVAVAALGGALRPLAVLALPLVVLVAGVQGAYAGDEGRINTTTIDEAPRLFQLATVFTLMFSVLRGLFVTEPLQARQLLVLWFATFLLTATARGVARGVVLRATSVQRCLFVGSEQSCERLRVKLESAGGRAVLVGRMSLGAGADREVLAAATALLHQLIDDLNVHRIVVEPSEPCSWVTLDFLREAKATGVRISLLPGILEVVGPTVEIDDLHGLTLLGVRRFGLSRSAGILKRASDVAGSSLGLLLTAPLLCAVAFVIRLDTRGPVLYRQTRVGRNGQPFTIWKFRTMVQGADALKPSLWALNEADGLFKIADDPRVTPVGRWLRRFSFDELPQLVNVLRGEMSLVGPRPLVVDDDAQITGLDRRRLDLTPGMTGQWQILGSARLPLSEMIRLDYLYVAGWSLWADVKILLRTVPYVMARRGM